MKNLIEVLKQFMGAVYVLVGCSILFFMGQFCTYFSIDEVWARVLSITLMFYGSNRVYVSFKNKN